SGPGSVPFARTAVAGGPRSGAIDVSPTAIASWVRFGRGTYAASACGSLSAAGVLSAATAGRGHGAPERAATATVAPSAASRKSARRVKPDRVRPSATRGRSFAITLLPSKRRRSSHGARESRSRTAPRGERSAAQTTRSLRPRRETEELEPRPGALDALEPEERHEERVDRLVDEIAGPRRTRAEGLHLEQQLGRPQARLEARARTARVRHRVRRDQ